MRAWHTILGRAQLRHLPAARPPLQHPHAPRAAFAACRASNEATDAPAPNDRLVQNTSVINKVPASFIMTQQLYTYLLEHTREPEVSCPGAPVLRSLLRSGPPAAPQACAGCGAPPPPAPPPHVCPLPSLPSAPHAL